MGVLHVPKGALEVVLCPVAQNDLFIAPVLVIGEQQRLAQLGFHQPGQGSRITPITQAGYGSAADFAMVNCLRCWPLKICSTCLATESAVGARPPLTRPCWRRRRQFWSAASLARAFSRLAVMPWSWPSKRASLKVISTVRC